MVGIVLIVACANAANLQLARAAARQREVAVRAALGASRMRIVRQLLTESVVLSCVAGAIGIALGYAALELLRAYGSAMVPRLGDVKLDTPVVVFAIAISLATGALFGVLPAVHAAKGDLAGVLRAGGRSESGGALGAGLRGTLTIGEIAMSLTLLVGAGLLLKSFTRLQAVDLGFNRDNVAVASVPTLLTRDSLRAANNLAELLARARALPGVQGAAAVSSAPFAGPNAGLVFIPVEQQPPNDGQGPDADYRTVTNGYFATLRIHLRGRDFSPADGPGAPGVVVISQQLARRYWPGQDPVGHRLRVGDLVRGPEFTIVGVAGDVRYQQLDSPDTRPVMYFSAYQRPDPAMMLVVRHRPGTSIAGDLRGVTATLDPSAPPPSVNELSSLVGEATSTRRFALVLFGAFAAITLIMASIGLYGVLAYLVRQRYRELGIRVALGASPWALRRMVVSGALRLAAIGVAIGVVITMTLSRFLESLLFEVEARDPGTYLGTIGLLIVVAIVASLLPAVRATRVDPLIALRGD